MTRRAKLLQKKISNDVRSGNYDIIFIFPICDQSGTIRMLVYARIVYKTFIFINSNFLFDKNYKHNLNTSNTALILLLWQKLSGLFYEKVYFLKQQFCVYLRAKFEVSNKSLMRFRLGGGKLPPPPQNEPLKIPPRLGLKIHKNSLVLIS